MTSNTLSKFLELNRTFHELSRNDLEMDEIRIRRTLGREDPLHWEQILDYYRVILISKAGSGKSSEIRHRAENLRAEKKAAFFIRLENISADFGASFEVGDYTAFEEWLASTDEGWIFLDSVDEARLRHPRDFERAIRILSKHIASAYQRTKLVITSRPEGWRRISDLALCIEALPYESSMKVTESSQDEEEYLHDDNFQSTSVDSRDGTSPFKIVALDDLDKDRVEEFVKWAGISDTRSFINAIERADAWEFTGRPQDLEELVEFWKDKQRIGGRLDILQNSISRRLRERDQDRADTRRLSEDRARSGARLVAAAATLGKLSNISIPDGSNSSDGIAVNQILGDWDDVEISTLLSRPVFDEAIYGCVRFHHRSVRELLTAEWIAELLKKETSRRKIESLLFRSQYGIEVVVPAMRSILPWLAILDAKVCKRLCEIAPAVLLEDGDPSKLPVETRREILEQVCHDFSTGSRSRIYSNYGAVQRFATKELAIDVKKLIAKYSKDDDVTSFLLRMVWLGELKDTLPEVKTRTLSSSSKYTRIMAIRALQTIGTDEDMRAVRQHVLKSRAKLDRAVFAELLYELKPTTQNIDWSLKCLTKVAPKDDHGFVDLAQELSNIYSKAEITKLPTIVCELNSLLERLPVIEQKHCEISQEYSWLLKPAGYAVQQLINDRHPASLEPTALGIVTKFGVSHNSFINDFDQTDIDFSTVVQNWSELNRELFWFDVQTTRRVNGDERATDIYHLNGMYWGFGIDDFEYFVNQINDREDFYEKRFALSVAFRLYMQGGRVRKQRELLKKVVKSQSCESLSQKLAENLKPRSTGSRSLKQMEMRLNRRTERWRKKQKENREKWANHLRANIDKVSRNCLRKGSISNEQYHIHEAARSKNKNLTQWTNGNWKCVIKDYGEEVAKAYRDGVVKYWRGYKPKLQSEGAEKNKTPFQVIFGLTGILIESRECPDWIKNLSASDVALACRYAFHELNGFPAWFPELYELHTSIVKKIIIKEINFEIATEQSDVDSNYVLSDIASSGRWAWNEIAQELYGLLKSKELRNINTFKNLLRIVQGSHIPDIEIAKLAAAKCKKTMSKPQGPLWFATWLGVDPTSAIPALQAHLAMLTKTKQTDYAMRVLVQLLGGRRESTNSRQVFQSPEHLKKLYLLMLQCINIADDIDRRGKGAYSPGLRDEAQRARDSLVEMIRVIPGKEAFIVLTELAQAYPIEDSRGWFASQAKAKAEADADIEPWVASQVREFHDKLECTPTNHRELAELVRFRLFDLKDDLEDGDNSLAGILMKADIETEIRNYIGRELREKAFGRYSVSQEEELADAKRMDLRINGIGFDAPVPCELKLSYGSATTFFERLENQLCGDYLRDSRSLRGFFVLVHQGKQKTWQLPKSRKKVNFQGLLIALEDHWRELDQQYPGVDHIEVVGIDLTKRKRLN